MKWNEMSVFHKVVFMLTGLSLFAMLVVSLCSICDVIPGLYGNPLYITLLGIVWLGQAILNWKKQRVLAIFNLVTALICFVALCGLLAFMLIIR